MWRMAPTVSLKLAAAQHRHYKFTSRHNEVATRAASAFISFSPSKSSSNCAGNARFFEAGNLHRQLITSHRHAHKIFLSTAKRISRKHRMKIKAKQVEEINNRIVAFGKKKDWAGILDMYEKEKEHFGNVNYATSMNQLGKIKSFPKDHNLLEEIMTGISTQLQIPTAGSWSARDIATVLHAVAKMKLKSDASRRLIDSILGEENLKILLESGNLQEIANLVWACAKLGVECPSLFQAIEDNALHFVENGNSQDIANTAWAFATLGVECPSLFKAINDNALLLVEKGNSKDIALMRWACATLGVECPLLFNKAIENNAL